MAACRAVLFASLVDDPSSRPDEFPTEDEQERERNRLFKIIEDLVKWENINDEQVLNKARQEILRSTDGNPPPVLDPFCGGGSIPLEAQRLGLEAHASDLNPVAVLITKAMIEIPPRFAGVGPVNPQDRKQCQSTLSEKVSGAAGLAEDVRYYGKWMRGEAKRRIGHLYPKAKLPDGGEATVIAWLWARTVKCPNPACGARMPLVRSFALSTKKNKKAWVEPMIESKNVRFEVKTGEGPAPEGTVNRRGARCIFCNTPVPFDHIRSEGKAGRMDAQMMAIVAEGKRGRIYLSPTEEHESIATEAVPEDVPETYLPEKALGFRVQLYGMTKHRDLFTPRQLLALTTFSDLAKEARDRVFEDALAAGLPDDGVGLNEGGAGARAYAEAVATYLALAVDRLADYNSTICTWHLNRETLGHTFVRHAIPMTWDFAEANPFSDSTGNFLGAVGWVAKVVEAAPCGTEGSATQRDATELMTQTDPVISTDPPYYDNIGYADLSDYFYVWLRRSLGEIHSDIFSTMLAPKVQELVATPYRFDGNKEVANRFFETGLQKAFENIRRAQNPEYPTTVYYAYKQAEKKSNTSTGWETMLEGLIKSGHTITGTWPMRTELKNRQVAMGTNALASSIVLVCRPRPDDAPGATRREFISALRRELPDALRKLQQGNIAPVDLAQAAIGPGMAVYSRYSKVLEADGNPMKVRTALQLINETLDEFLAEQEGEYGPDTRWALAWFEQFGMNEGPFGEAETLSKAKNTSVSGMVDAGFLHAGGGKVRLLRRDELDPDWDPVSDKRLTVWEATQHLAYTVEKKGVTDAAQMLQKLGDLGESARDLAYRLYTISDRKGWTQEALAYNMLVAAWTDISEREVNKKLDDQTTFG